MALICSVRGQQTLSEEEQEEILNAHNYYRSLVDPIATNMLKMVFLTKSTYFVWRASFFLLWLCPGT